MAPRAWMERNSQQLSEMIPLLRCGIRVLRMRRLHVTQCLISGHPRCSLLMILTDTHQIT